MTGPSTDRSAALGFRCHSGWAAVILVACTAATVEVIDRRRIELCDLSVNGSKQPFHAVEAMPFPKAEAFIAGCRESTDNLTSIAIATLVSLASSRGLRLASCGVLWASGRPLPALSAILQSHALIHAAEGQFYRDAVARACDAAGLSVSRIRESDVLRQTCDRVGLSEAQIRDRLTVIGKSLGSPWTADQKLATLAGWAAVP